jgi:hypothetical protein
MNQNFAYSPNNLFDLRAGNATSIGETIILHDEVVFGELPLDTGNDDLLTIDALHRVHKLPVSSLPGGNPFDQDLNTTDSVEFGSTVSPPSVKEPTDVTLRLNTDQTGTYIGCYKDGETVPHVSISAQGNFSNDGSINLGGYFDSAGDFIMTQPRGFSIDNNSTDTWFHSWTGAVGTPGSSIVAMNFRALGGGQVRYFGRVLLGDGVDTSTAVAEHFCIMGTSSANPATKVARADVFGQDLITTADVEFNSLTLGSVSVDNAETKLLVLDGTGLVQYRDVSSLPSSGNPFDQDLNTTDSVQFDQVTLNTPGIPSESDASFVLIKQTNDVVKQVAPEDLYGQSLYQNGDVIHNSLELGVVTGSVGTAKLKISDVEATPAGNFTELGSEIGLYNDGNDLALLQLSALNTEEQTLGFGIHTALGGTNPYHASSTSFNMITRAGDELQFLNNNGPQVIGDPITFKNMMTITPNEVVIDSAADFRISDLASQLTPAALIANSGTGVLTQMNRAVIFEQNLTAVSDVDFNTMTLGTVPQDDLQTKLLVWGDAGLLEYRDASSLPSSNPFDQSLNVADDVEFNSLKTDDIQEGTVAAGVKINSKLFLTDLGAQNSVNFLLSIDQVSDQVEQSTNVTLSSNGDLLLPQFSLLTAGFLVVKTMTENSLDRIMCSDASGIVSYRDISTVNPFDQDLNQADNVVFNNIFSDGLVQTDTILENTTNAGVSVSSWSIKPQRLVSDALVSTSDPLIIDLKFNADIDSAIQIYAEQHDNVGHMMDMRHINGTDSDSFISSSVNGNFFWNKIGNTLKLLAQNGIAKGSAVSKAAMNSVVEYTKTSILLNEPVTFAESIVADNLTSDTGANTVYITKNVTGELQEKLFEASYGSVGITDNATATVIALVDTYVVLNLAGTTTPNKLCTVTSNSLTPQRSGLYEISYNLNVFSGLVQDKVYRFAVFVNGVAVVSASIMDCTIETVNHLCYVGNVFLYDHTANDVLSVRVKNLTDDEDITLKNGLFSVKRIFAE